MIQSYLVEYFQIKAKMAKQRLIKTFTKTLDRVLKEDYLSKKDLTKKYPMHTQKIWRLIKDHKLPYDNDIRMIPKNEFEKWEVKNKHLLINNQGKKGLKSKP